MFGAGATNACGGPLTNEIISRGFDSAYQIEREDFLGTLRKFLKDNFFEVSPGLYPLLPFLISFLDKAIGCIRGDSVFAPRYRLGRNRAQLQLIFLRSSEIFVNAHEYGHVLLDHLSKGRERKTVLAEQQAREIRYAWKQEYEADIKVIELAIQAMRSYGIYIPVSVLGIGMFFSAVTILDQIRDGLRTRVFSIQESKQRGTHPPAYVRLMHLKDAVECPLPDGNGRQCGFLLDLPYVIMTMMLKLTEDHWIGLHEDGVRSASLHEF